MDIILTSTGAQRPNGQPVVEISGLPSAVVRDLLRTLAGRLERAGYHVHDERPAVVVNPGAVCQRCHTNPPATPRAKYCRDCQPLNLADQKHRVYGGVRK